MAKKTVSTETLPWPGTAQVSQDLAAALDELGSERPLGTDPQGRQLRWVSPSLFRAATISPRPDSEILFVGLPRRGKPEWRWIPAARFDLVEDGSRTIRRHRPFLLDLSVQHLAALDTAFGGTDFASYRSKFTANPVSLQAVAMQDLSRYQAVRYVKFCGAWHTAGRHHSATVLRPEDRGAAERQRDLARGYSDHPEIV